MKTNNLHSIIKWTTAILVVSFVIWYVSKKQSSGQLETRNQIVITNQSIKKIQNQVDSILIFQNLLIQKSFDMEFEQAKTQELINKNNLLLGKNTQAINNMRLKHKEIIYKSASYNYKELDSFFQNRYQK